MRTQFCIYGEPRGKERPKFSTVCGHVTARTPENTVLYENLVKTEYRIQSGVRFADDAMLSVRIFAFLSVPRSASQKKHLAMIDRLIRPTRKPDFDNIGKIICDALNGIAYRDSALSGRVGDYFLKFVFYLNFSASCFITFSISMASNGTGPRLSSGMLKLFRQSS